MTRAVVIPLDNLAREQAQRRWVSSATEITIPDARMHPEYNVRRSQRLSLSVRLPENRAVISADWKWPRVFPDRLNGGF